MLYLRARWYDTEVGRFARRDPWTGSIERPVLLHPYLYVGANPVNYTDRTGLCLDSDQVCHDLVDSVESEFQVHFDRAQGCESLPLDGRPLPWTGTEVMRVRKTLELLRSFWGRSAFYGQFTPINFRRVTLPYGMGKYPTTAAVFTHIDPLPGRRPLFPGPMLEAGSLAFYQSGPELTPDRRPLPVHMTFKPASKTIGDLMHEMYHMFDWSMSGNPDRYPDPGWRLQQCRNASYGEGEWHAGNFGIQADWHWGECGIASIDFPRELIAVDSPAPENYGKRNPAEDFAETYRMTTLYLLGGGVLCPSVNYCIASRTRAPAEYVGAQANPFALPFGEAEWQRSIFFIEDCLQLGANVDTRVWERDRTQQ